MTESQKLGTFFFGLKKIKKFKIQKFKFRIQQGEPCSHGEMVEGFCHMVMVMVMW